MKKFITGQSSFDKELHQISAPLPLVPTLLTCEAMMKLDFTAGQVDALLTTVVFHHISTAGRTARARRFSHPRRTARRFSGNHHVSACPYRARAGSLGCRKGGSISSRLGGPRRSSHRSGSRRRPDRCYRHIGRASRKSAS